MIASKSYTVSDGEMLLNLEPVEEGGFVVTSPLDPELITEAESLAEAFENARDATAALNESRTKLAAQFSELPRLDGKRSKLERHLRAFESVPPTALFSLTSPPPSPASSPPTA